MKLKFYTKFCISAFVIFSVLACTSNKPKVESSVDKTSQSTPSTNRAKTQNSLAVTEKQQAQSDLNRLVEKKQLSQGISVASNPQNKNATFAVTPEEVRTPSQLYDQMVYQYEIRNLVGFQIRMDVMEKKFSRTPEMADALYLAGLVQMNAKNYGKALKYFAQIQNHFPQNHQLASVLYSKGVIYRKMDLKLLASNQWNQLIEKYPGSPEAEKAKSEQRSEQVSQQKIVK